MLKKSFAYVCSFIYLILSIYKCLSFLWRTTCETRQDDGVGGEQRARFVRMTMFAGEQRARFVQSSPAKAGYATAGRMTVLMESSVQGSAG